jgi:predicted amidohydrolase
VKPWITLTLSCAVALAALPLTAQNQSPEPDLLIRGGRVVDPRNNIDAVLDVAVSGGRIANVAANIQPTPGQRVVDAKGLYVIPGLIDIHSHVFYGTEEDAYLSNGFSAVPPDSHSFRSGQTTLVDVGGAGWRNFPQFKRSVIDRSRTRVLSFLNIVGNGMKGGPVEQDLDDMDARLTAMRIRQHPGVIVGVKRPYVLEARKRGIVFDVGHGGGSFLFRQAVPATKQGFYPDVISTDLHTGSMNSGMKNILNTMSKFLNLGMPLGDVIKANTVRAAAVIKRPDLGHLGVGAEADIAVLNLRRGTFGFVDSGGGKMQGDQKLECELTVKGGQVVWDLNGISRPLWSEMKETSTR